MSALDRFVAAASDAGVEVQVTRYPEGTRTAADAASAVGCDVSQIVKSLVFVVDGRPVLALTSGSNRVDPGKLALAVGGSRARQATPDEVREATSFAIGGTPPFGHPSPVVTFVDRDLLAHDTVWAAAGTPDSCFAISPGALLEAVGVVEASDITE